MLYKNELTDLPQLMSDTKTSRTQKTRRAFNILKQWDIRRNQIQIAYYDIVSHYLERLMELANESEK